MHRRASSQDFAVVLGRRCVDLSFLAFLWRGIAVSHAAVHGGHLGRFFGLRARTIPCMTDRRFRTGRMCAPLVIAWKNALSIGWRLEVCLLACDVRNV